MKEDTKGLLPEVRQFAEKLNKLLRAERNVSVRSDIDSLADSLVQDVGRLLFHMGKESQILPKERSVIFVPDGLSRTKPVLAVRHYALRVALLALLAQQIEVSDALLKDDLGAKLQRDEKQV